MPRILLDWDPLVPERAIVFDAGFGGSDRGEEPRQDLDMSRPLMAIPQSEAASHGPLVLVVDDDAQMRDYIRTCLSRLPVRVAEAVDGQDALDQIAERTGDGLALVVTDLVMPRMDGRALKATLHADPRWVDVPVLLVTGEAVRARDGPVLRKPFNARRLSALARSLLSI